MRAMGRGDGLDVDQAGPLGADCPDGLIPNQSAGRFHDAASIIAIPSRSGRREADVSATSSLHDSTCNEAGSETTHRP
jgi:hypothetical protein